jgi:hypothetical protein
MIKLSDLEDAYSELGSYGAVARRFGIDRRGVARRLKPAPCENFSSHLFKRYIIIPDLQVKEGVDLRHIDWICRYIKEKKPYAVVQLGDLADMPSLSSYDKGKKSFEGRRYKKDIKIASDVAKRLGFACIGAGVESRNILYGNHEHRICRATELQPELDGLLCLDDLGYDAAGWTTYEFLQVVELDGICFSHYFVSGVMGRPITSAATLLTKKHQSCIAGHQQGKAIAYATKADGGQLTGIIAGSCYLHDEDYLGPQANNHFRGIFVLNEVHNGQFDECVVSLDFLRRKYA